MYKCPITYFVCVCGGSSWEFGIFYTGSWKPFFVLFFCNYFLWELKSQMRSTYKYYFYIIIGPKMIEQNILKYVQWTYLRIFCRSWRVGCSTILERTFRKCLMHMIIRQAIFLWGVSTDTIYLCGCFPELTKTINIDKSSQISSSSEFTIPSLYKVG